MSVLYCTVPNRVKYSTVIGDEYRKVTEKIDYWRADLRYIYWIRVPTNQVLASCFFFFFFFFGGGGGGVGGGGVWEGFCLGA